MRHLPGIHTTCKVVEACAARAFQPLNGYDAAYAFGAVHYNICVGGYLIHSGGQFAHGYVQASYIECFAFPAFAHIYQHEFVPALRAQGQTPPLDEVRDRIREVLTQRGITERADQWFDETKSRLQIEIIPPPAVEGKP